MRKIILLAIGAILTPLLLATQADATGPHNPTCGSFQIDGNISEWNLQGDYFAPMYEAGKPDKDILADSYLRYNVGGDANTNNGMLGVLVVLRDGYTLKDAPDDQWAKIRQYGEISKCFDGTRAHFSYLDQGQGFEATCPLPNRQNADIIIHAQTEPDRTAALLDYLWIFPDCDPPPTAVTMVQVSADVTDRAVPIVLLTLLAILTAITIVVFIRWQAQARPGPTLIIEPDGRKHIEE